MMQRLELTWLLLRYQSEGEEAYNSGEDDAEEDEDEAAEDENGVNDDADAGKSFFNPPIKRLPWLTSPAQRRQGSSREEGKDGPCCRR